MSKSKTSAIAVQGTAASIITGKDGDYISLTDMLRAKDGGFSFSTGYETVTPWSSLASGSPSSTPLLIMANSPQLA